MQKRVQRPPATDCIYSQQQSQVPIKTAPCDLVQEAANGKMTPTGLRIDDVTICNSYELRQTKNSGDAKCVAHNENQLFSIDDKQILATIITLWPELSRETKASIIQVIKADTVAPNC